MTQGQIYRRELSGGILSVQTASDLPLESLFDIAERKNPKRAFLFVSKVLGRHIPVSPATMNETYQALAGQLPANLPGPVLFIGMAETAVGMAAGVFREARKNIAEPVLITSTRHPVDGDLLCEFKENHSHATDHLIYKPQDSVLRQRALTARSLVLIDDEATTGNTFVNLLEALRNAGLTSLERVVTVTLTDWSGDALQENCPLPVDVVSMVKGSWSWSPRPDAPVPVMPFVNVTARGTSPVSQRQDWGRLGMDETRCTIANPVAEPTGEKILVLGSGEFVWQPFLLAEQLEKDGAEVKFSSLTRSPISQGHAIHSTIAFSDNYGLGIPNFVYNVAHQQFDRVIICVETAKESVCQSLIASLLKSVTDRVEVVSYE